MPEPLLQLYPTYPMPYNMCLSPTPPLLYAPTILPQPYTLSSPALSSHLHTPISDFTCPIYRDYLSPPLNSIRRRTQNTDASFFAGMWSKRAKAHVRTSLTIQWSSRSTTITPVINTPPLHLKSYSHLIVFSKWVIEWPDGMAEGSSYPVFCVFIYHWECQIPTHN